MKESKVTHDFSEVKEKEIEIIRRRRRRISNNNNDENVDSSLVGLALSGGGIRSAVTNLGVLQGLSRFGLLRKVDYLSTVSGGGYIGCCLTSLLSLQCRNGEQDESKPVYSTDWHNFPLRDASHSLLPQTGSNQNPCELISGEVSVPDCKGISLGAQIGYIRSRANYLIPRALPFGADTLRAVGAMVWSAIFSLLWFFSIMFLITTIYLELVSWVVGTDETVGRSRTVVIEGEISPTVFESSVDCSQGEGGEGLTPLGKEGDTHLNEAEKAEKNTGYYHPQTVSKHNSLQQGAKDAVASLVYDSLSLLKNIGTCKKEIGAVTFIGMCWGLLTIWLTVSRQVKDRKEPTGQTEISKQDLHFVNIGTVLMLLLALIVPPLYMDIHAPQMLLLPTFFSFGGVLACLVNSVFTGGWGSGVVNRTCGMFVYASVATAVMALLPSVIRAGNGLFIALIIGCVVPVIRYLLLRFQTTGILKRSGKNSLKAKILKVLFDIFVPLCILLTITWIGIVLVDGNNWPTNVSFFSLVIWDNSHWQTVIILASSFIIFLALSLVDINHFSLHGFYRDQLAKAFLVAVVTGKQGNVSTVSCGNDISRLHGNLGGKGTKKNQCSGYGPYLLINTTLNLTASYNHKNFQRKSDSFIISRCYVGSQQTGYTATENYGDQLRLDQAMTISGAAVSPVMGAKGSLLTAFSCTVLGIRLGQWIPNPSWIHKKKDWYFGGKWLFNEMCHNTHERDKRVYLSDGGHSGDNLGILPLLQRRVKLLIVSDAECDTEYIFESLNSSMRKAYVDEGIRIDIDLTRLRSDTSGYVDRHFAVGRIRYPDRPMQQSWIIILKSGVSGDEIEPVVNYHRTNPVFPHETTADQLFTEEQFESYRSLGNHFVKQLLHGEKEMSLMDKDGVSSGESIEKFCRQFEGN